MKIGLCHKDIGLISRGGVCRLYKELANALRDSGEEVFIISARGDWEPEGITVVTIKPTEDKLTYSQQVAQALPDLNLDIVECSSWGFELLSYLRSEVRTTKTIVRGDLTAATLGAHQYAFSEKELMERAESIICVSQFAKEDIKHQYGITAQHVIYNGVDTDSFRILKEIPAGISSGYRFVLQMDNYKKIPLSDCPLPLSHEGLRIVWTGKPTTMKGFDILQNIVALSPPSFRFYLCIGHSPEEIRIIIGSDPRVFLLQDLSDTDYVALLNFADVFLCTSRWEGFGLSPLEAMACGCPVVYWNHCEALKEFIREDKDGISFSTAEDCLRVLVLTTKAEMGRNAAQQARAFSWQKNCQESLKIYMEAMKK